MRDYTYYLYNYTFLFYFKTSNKPSYNVISSNFHINMNSQN